MPKATFIEDEKIETSSYVFKLGLIRSGRHQPKGGYGVIKRVLGRVAQATDVTSVVYSWHNYRSDGGRPEVGGPPRQGDQRA